MTYCDRTDCPHIMETTTGHNHCRQLNIELADGKCVYMLRYLKQSPPVAAMVARSVLDEMNADIQSSKENRKILDRHVIEGYAKRLNRLFEWGD